jgi:hypothetical protein
MANPDINRVRDLYTWTTAWSTDVEGRDDLRRLQESQRADFDAALAAHDAELRARIAREVRDYFTTGEFATGPGVVLSSVLAVIEQRNVPS